jgi:hypothetical protein
MDLCENIRLADTHKASINYNYQRVLGFTTFNFQQAASDLSRKYEIIENNNQIGCLI